MKVQVGGVCPRGNGHVWTYDPNHEDDHDSAMSCGGKSWPMFIQVDETDPDEWDALPDWLRDIANDGGMVT